MDNAADRKAIRAKEKQAAITEASRQSVLHTVMSTVEGRTFIWDFLGSCHVFSTTFTGDALTSAFAEGERNVGQRLLSDIMAVCPDQYIQAMREANERHHRDDARADTLAERRGGEEPNGRDSGREGYDVDYDTSRWIDDPDTYNPNGTLRTDH
jgi:hypothetical protein